MKLVIILSGHEGVGKRTLAEALYSEFFVRHVHEEVPLLDLIDHYNKFMIEKTTLLVVVMNDPREIQTFLSILTVPHFIIQIKRRGIMTDERHPIEDLGIIPVFHNDYAIETSKQCFVKLIEGVCTAVRAREEEHDWMIRTLDRVLERR